MPLTYDNSRIVDGLMPSLDLGFSENDYRLGLKKVGFSDIVTFSRASGGGRFNASGQYEWLPANEPRFDFDPVTGECRGILIEEQRTNLLLRSAEFDSASWAKTSISVVANAATAPDGTMTAKKLVEDSSDGQHRVQQSVALASNTTVCMSAFLKSGERSKALVIIVKKDGSFRCRLFDLSAGTHSQPTTPGYTTPPANFGMEDVGDGWYRCWVSDSVGDGGTINDTGRVFIFNGAPSYAGDGTSGIYIWGAQLEAGAFPTSYIPTTTAQVTRAADVCSVDNLSPWYRADEGTLLVDFVNRSTVTPPAVSEDFACIADSSADSRISIVRPAGASLLRGSVFSGLAAQADITLGTVVPDQRRVAAIAFKKDYFAASANGGVVGKDTSGVVPSVTKLGVGSRGINFAYANGHIRRIRYIPRRISDTELQAITAL